MGIFDIFLPNNAIFSQKIAQNWRFFPKNRLSHTILQNAPKTTYTTPNPTLWDRRLPSSTHKHVGEAFAKSKYASPSINVLIISSV